MRKLLIASASGLALMIGAVATAAPAAANPALLIIPWAILAGGGGVMAGAAVANQPHTTVVEAPPAPAPDYGAQGDFAALTTQPDYDGVPVTRRDYDGVPVAEDVTPLYPAPCRVERQWDDRYGWREATICD
jgi:hypothetical protein